MVAISPQLPRYSKQIKSKHSLEFDVLSDPGNQKADEFGLAHKLPDYLIELYKNVDIDLERFNGNDSWTLPMPARYIASREGKVLNAEVNADYTRRPEPSEIVEILKSIA